MSLSSVSTLQFQWPVSAWAKCLITDLGRLMAQRGAGFYPDERGTRAAAGFVCSPHSMMLDRCVPAGGRARTAADSQPRSGPPATAIRFSAAPHAMASEWLGWPSATQTPLRARSQIHGALSIPTYAVPAVTVRGVSRVSACGPNVIAARTASRPRPPPEAASITRDAGRTSVAEARQASARMSGPRSGRAGRAPFRPAPRPANASSYVFIGAVVVVAVTVCSVLALAPGAGESRRAGGERLGAPGPRVSRNGASQQGERSYAGQYARGQRIAGAKAGPGR